MRYDAIFIIAGLLCLLCGEGLGIWMGVHENFTLAPAHAHLNLVGWVTLSLYGLIHRTYPGLKTSRLAPVQCVLAVIGAVLLPAGIAYGLLHQVFIGAIVGSFIVITATLLFVIMFIRKHKALPA
ncbi:MAG: hypothetical protein WDM79_14455 [Terricaulis sp.]